MEVLGASFRLNLKSEDLGFIVEYLWWQYDGLWIMLEENVREGRSEVCAVNVDATSLWKVDLFASWAEDLEP